MSSTILGPRRKLQCRQLTAHLVAPGYKLRFPTDCSFVRNLKGYIQFPRHWQWAAANSVTCHCSLWHVTPQHPVSSYNAIPPTVILQVHHWQSAWCMNIFSFLAGLGGENNYNNLKKNPDTWDRFLWLDVPACKPHALWYFRTRCSLHGNDKTRLNPPIVRKGFRHFAACHQIH